MYQRGSYDRHDISTMQDHGQSIRGGLHLIDDRGGHNLSGEAEK